jgi:hypothetical protein
MWRWHTAASCSAGTFDPEEGSVPVAAAVEEEKRELALFDAWKKQLATAVRRLVLWSAFVFTKRPQRIKQVGGLGHC